MRKCHRLRPLLAYRAWKRLWANPDDTAAVFEILDALRGRSDERVFRRFAASPQGQQILAERRELLQRLSDRATLRALPEDSLGKRYAAFMDAEAISAEELAKASDAQRGEPYADADLQRFVCRWRDMHDLHHVVTGYGRDLHGEAALLAFTFAQTPTLGLGFIIGMAYLNGDAEDRRMIRAGYRRGRRAAWLVNADWEALLERPVSEVRSSLCVGTPPQYTPLWSAGAPAAAAPHANPMR